jgi:hypothetical protein
MSGKRKYRKVIWIIVFTFVIGITGCVLSSTGNMRNPFAVFTALAQASEQGPQADRGQAVVGGNVRRPPDDAANGEGGGERGEASIAWSQIGGVLFNVWFLLATADMVIIVQTVMGYLKERLRPRKRWMALANAA